MCKLPFVFFWLVLSSVESFSFGNKNDYIDGFFPNSCSDLSDGVHKLKLLEGDFPVVNIKCSNGYMILDINFDNNLQYYFDSLVQYHSHMAGPSNTVFKRWYEWFKPSFREQNDFSFLISDDCNSCSEDSLWNIAYGNKTVYYMTGELFGCLSDIAANEHCNVRVSDDYYYCSSCGNSVWLKEQIINEELLAKYQNNVNILKNFLKLTGSCAMQLRPYDYDTPHTHDECSSPAGQSHIQPSIGIHGQKCVCYKSYSKSKYHVGKQSNSKIHSFVHLNIDGKEKFINFKKKNHYKKDENTVHSINDKYKLYSSDFEKGTYRITNPGTYVIMEDIEFNFNADESDVINGWKPKESQSDSYPGAGGYTNTYHLGFFAGITIECDNVIIDLNSHTLSMHEHFYYQQRWFTVIELSKQYFWTGQGINNFGPEPHASKNVIIKNGILGLSSHHGIHGNYNKNIYVHDVVVKDFETCGIQFNGFNNIELKNVNVGPTSNLVSLNGEFGHWKYLLPRLELINEENNYPTIKFDNRESSTTVTEIIDEIKTKMEYAFNYVTKDISYSREDSEYDDFVNAIRLFTNEKKVPYASSQYGIFLNTRGASVLTFSVSPVVFSYNAKLINVKIHGMRHSMQEYLRFFRDSPTDLHRNPFFAPLDAKSMVEDWDSFSLEDFQNGKIKYYGNILTDAIFAFAYFTESWDYLGTSHIEKTELVAWALFGDASGISNIGLGSNNDIMIHSGKGLIGLRLDGIHNVEMNNIEIYDLYDSTPLGTTITGNYSGFDDQSDRIGGHFAQTLPMQDGFSGDMLHGIHICSSRNITMNNIKIHDLSSDNGQVFGIGIYPGNFDFKFGGEYLMYNLYAGIKLEKGLYSYNDRPNSAPEVCGLKIYEFKDFPGGSIEIEPGNDKYGNVMLNATNYIATIVVNEDSTSRFSHLSYCMDGHVGCFDGDFHFKLKDYSLTKYGISYINSTLVSYKNVYTMLSGDYNYNKKCSNSIHLKENSNKNSKITNIKNSVILIFTIVFPVLIALYVLFQLYNKEKSKSNVGYFELRNDIPYFGQEY